MIDIKDELLSTLAKDLVDLHLATGLELEFWDTATEFVENFYHVTKVDDIVYGKRVMIGGRK